jgi:sugar O-acyltransferase (sialic acid O-acetyltransferase NeuD family)
VSKPSILLIGAGGHAQSCIDVIEQEGEFRIAGLVGSPHELGSNIFGYPVLGTDSDLPNLQKKIQYALVTVGQIKTPKPRMTLFQRADQIGFVMPTIVSPMAYVSPHAVLGTGTIVMHGAIINAGVVIGSNCILNSRTLVEHGAAIGDHCHIATAAIVNGDAIIGAGTFIGSGAGVRESIKIGEHCLIGMGQMVLADCPDGYRMPAGKEKN